MRSERARRAGQESEFAFLVLAAVIAAISLTIAWPYRDMTFSISQAAGFAVAFFATRLLTIRLPQGDEVYVGLVVAISALAVTDISVVLLAAGVAAAVELVARFSNSPAPASMSRAVDAIRGVCVLAWMAPFQPALHRVLQMKDSGDRIVLLVLGVGVCYALLEVLTIAVHQGLKGGLPLTQAVEALQRALLTMYLVHLSMAAVAVRLYAASGAWAFPIALLLTLILQNSFNLYLRIRRGYSDTIGALARAAELDRPQDAGHAKRVADLAVSVGRRLGMPSRELEQVGYAALLHDIGRMGEGGDDKKLHTSRGAMIVSSIPFLSDVAPLIEQTSWSSDDRPLLGADIVRICSHYDRLRCERGAHQALSSLEKEADGASRAIIEALAQLVQGNASRVGTGR